MNPGEILVVGPNISSDDLEKTIETVNGVLPEADAEPFLRHHGAGRDPR